MEEKHGFKSWSTRKKMLFFAVIAVLVYTTSDIVLTFIYANTGSSMYFDSTLTTEFFEFMKLISGLGGGLTVAETAADAVKSFAHRDDVPDSDTPDDGDDIEDLG